ncbi:YitT family protein [Clostridium sp. Marseille-P299]|uniref:YitT family protein n=1 Tax=Clostridium sp. Marseille-P299 TaxID=1805477 RepID=UPI00083023ED|nr:YitT family protein [Clostridium sp. Marseille-P299]
MPNKNSQEPLKLWYEYLWLTIGVLLVAVGVYFFKFPNNYSIGGVTGLAILFSKITNGALSSGTIVLIVNMALLVVGYLVLGKGTGFKTAYGSIVLSGALALLEKIYPMNAPFTNEPILELFFAVLLPAVGAAILFNLGGSTGGTDIIAMILKKYTNTDIGKALFATDLLLTLATFPLFGMETGLLSLTGLILKSAVIDNMIESMNLCKYFTIICDDPKPICSYILKTLNRSATVYDARGAFSDHDKKIILTVMSRAEAIKLQRYIKQTEPDAFILITNTSEIIGRGFRA